MIVPVDEEAPAAVEDDSDTLIVPVDEEAPAAAEDDSDTLIVPVDEETAAPSEEAEGDSGAAKGIAPTAPLQASVVETRVAEEALVPTPTPEKKFKYVSPFVTVGK